VSEIDADGPPEPVAGQDDTPPNLELAVLVTIRVLLDVRSRLRATRDVGEGADDLLLRIAALLSVLHKIRRQLEERP